MALKVNLEREGGRNTEGSLDDAIKTILRFAGFAHTFLGMPLDLAYLGNGMIVAKYLKFLSGRPKRDKKNHSYLELMLRHICKLMAFLAKQQPLRSVGLLDIVAKIRECRSQLHTVSIVTPINTNDLIEKGEAKSYDELAILMIDFAGAQILA